MGGKRKDGSKRTLVRWSDDLDKQLLLSIQFACNEAGLRIPWDNVAKLMGEKFSDGAIVQHMSKLRQKMVDNNLPVPPPLKRGTTVVPSKIYANSGTARRKSMPETPTNAPALVETPKPKQSTTKKRTRRPGFESDSDSQPDENEMDIADTSDEEYGASARKRKKRQTKNKQPARKQSVQESMNIEGEEPESVQKERAAIETQGVNEEVVQESVETPGPASRTRGVRPDYSKLEQGSDEEEDDGDVADVKKEFEGEAEDEELVADDDEDDTKIKSDGEISPRSKVPKSPATPAPLTNLGGFNDSPHSGNGARAYSSYIGTAPQYQSPQNSFAGVSSASYHPRSNMTSFSTHRNDSTSSYSSLRPTFSSQSSLSHAALGHMPLSGNVDYLNQGGFDFNGVGSAFEHDTSHGGQVFPLDDDDHDEFGGLFDESHGY